MDSTPDVVNLYNATRHRLDVLGVVHLTVTVAGQTSRQPFIVVRKLGTDAILRTDFIDSQVERIQQMRLRPSRLHRGPNL